MPDSWELAFAPNLTTLSANADSDGDGVTDGDERASGTNPLDPNSRFQLREIRPQTGGQFITASFDSIPGRNYRVWVSADLGTWSDMGTIQSADWPATATAFQISRANLPPGGEQKLFLKVAVIRESP